MKREALVPVDEELLALISGQQQRVLDRCPSGIVLFPRPRTLTGRSRLAAPPTGWRSTAGWSIATPATSTAGPST
jgi:hypothetical protein